MPNPKAFYGKVSKAVVKKEELPNAGKGKDHWHPLGMPQTESSSP